MILPFPLEALCRGELSPGTWQTHPIKHEWPIVHWRSGWWDGDIGLKAPSHMKVQVQSDPFITAHQVIKSKHSLPLSVVFSLATRSDLASGVHPGLRDFNDEHCTSPPLHVLPSTLPQGAKLLRWIHPQDLTNQQLQLLIGEVLGMQRSMGKWIRGQRQKCPGGVGEIQTHNSESLS